MKRDTTSCRALLVRAAVVAVTAIGAARADAQVEAARYVGCYDVDLGEWSPGPLPSDSIHYLPPARVRLSAEPGRGPNDRTHGYALDPAPGAMPSIHRYSWWSTVGDSLLLGWSTGLAGITARVAGDGVLQGEARRFTDVVPARQFTVPVRLTSVDCEAPVPEARQVSYRFSPVVRLSGGLTLTLDSVPPPGLKTERLTEVWWLVHGEAAAPYDGAERVEMALHADGTIRAIRLQYPPDARVAAVVSALSQHFGAPTSEDARADLAMWSSRLMYIAVTGTGGHVQVRLLSQRW